MPHVIVDRNGAVWLRFGTNIKHWSAMTTWLDETGQEMLVLGAGTTGLPNLCRATYSKNTEEGTIASNSSVENTITTEYNTKNFDFGIPDVEKQVRCVDVIYQDHPNWTETTFTIKYRINSAGSDNVPTWTTLGTVTLGTATYYYETKHKTIDATNLTLTGKTFQFQITSTAAFRINKLIVYYDILSKKRE